MSRKSRPDLEWIAEAVRRRFVRRGRRAGAVCVEAAAEVTAAVNAAGGDGGAMTVRGAVLPAAGDVFLACHCWTETSDGWLVDVTLDQLGPRFPAVLVDRAARCRDHDLHGVVYSHRAEFFAARAQCFPLTSIRAAVRRRRQE